MKSQEKMQFNVMQEYDPIDRPPLGEDEYLHTYLNSEPLSMAAEGYAGDAHGMEWREKALIVIFTYSKCKNNFDPVVPYLAMSYFDRYMSRRNPVPALMRCRLHDLELLAICCLTLAWKIRYRYFKVRHFKAIQRSLPYIAPQKFWTMELCILQGLDWKLCTVTPFSFLQYFGNPMFGYSSHGFHRTINETIIQSQSEMSITQFRPSVIAGAAFLLASSFDPSITPFPSFAHSFSSVNKNYQSDLMACFNTMTSVCKKLKILDFHENPKRQQSGTSGDKQVTRPPKRKKVVTEIEMTEMPKKILGTEGIEYKLFDFALQWGIGEAEERKYIVFWPFSELAEPKRLPN